MRFGEGSEGKPRVGVVGLGRMGTAIAARLANCGFDIVGWTRRGVDPEDASRLSIGVATQIASLGQQSDVILLSLFDAAAVTEVVTRLAAEDLSGKLIVDTSTVGPETLRSLAAHLVRAGASSIDAPISGGPEMVLKGAAGVYIGGDEVDVGRFMPIAQAFCSRIHHVGGPGAGAAAKIVNNMVLVGYWQVLREALQVGKRSGLSLETMLDVLRTSPAANGALVARMPSILGESDDVAFTVEAAVKDASLFARTAAQCGVAAPALDAALASFLAHRERGKGKADVASVLSAAYAEI